MLVIRCIRLLGGLPWGASWCSISRCKAALILSASLTICITEGIGWDKILSISSRDFRASIISERSTSCKTKMSLNWSYKNNKNPLFAVAICERQFTWLYLTIIRHRRSEYCWINPEMKLRDYATIFTEPEGNNCFCRISELNNRE